jgi:signal transduction histidine kinase
MALMQPEGAAYASPEAGFRLIAPARFESVIRHRLRNFCAGMRMAVAALLDNQELQSIHDRQRLAIMREELDDLLRFADRLSFLFGPPPEPHPGVLAELLAEMEAFFAERFPLCAFEMTGERSQAVMPAANWLSVVLRELLANAGEAAGRTGAVRLFWRLQPDLAFGVATYGASWPPEVPAFPFRPFCSARSRHDGIGMAIVQRYCALLELDLGMPGQVPGALVFVVSKQQAGVNHA